MPSAPSVFITGASSGIGSALARHYAAQGAVLGLAARRGEHLQTLAKALEGTSPERVSCYPLDVSDAEALHAAAEDFIRHYGAPDIVIANDADCTLDALTERARQTAMLFGL